MVENSRQIRDLPRRCDLLGEPVFQVFPLVEERHRMALARSKLTPLSCACKSLTTAKGAPNNVMDPNINDRSAGSRGSSRREFLGRTIRGGALLAATTVLGNELRSPEKQAESQTEDLTRNPSSDASATTADLLAEKLVEWGVSLVFGIPGDKNAHIMDALRRRQDKIRFVLVRHEEGAAFMASGYAKFTGKLGVCVSTAGPGAVHLLNGLYDAKFDGAPVLAITGAPPRALLGTQFTQGVDTISLYDDVTSGVYNELVTGPYHLLSVADMARRAALARRGVAHLSFPIDVQAKRLDDDDESLGVDVQHGTAGSAPCP